MSDPIIDELLNSRSALSLAVMGNKKAYWKPFTKVPGIVALYDMSILSPLFDRSGNGRVLTKSGTATIGTTRGGGKYAVKATADYWTVNDAAWNSPTGALFIAGWVKHAASASTQETYLSKWTPTGNQRCFVLRRDATGHLSFTVSTDGINSYGVTSDATYTTNWTFVAGLFTPSVGTDCWVDTTKKSYTTTPPATIIDGTGALEVGSWIGGGAGFAGFEGIMGIYNAIPTDAQIIALRNATSKYYPNP